MPARLREMWRALNEPVQGPGRRGDVEIIEESDALVLTAEMFDTDREDIRVDVSPSRVVIKTEAAGTGGKSASRSIPLPHEVVPDEAEAQYNNGILEVFLPKRHLGSAGSGGALAKS